MVPDYGTATDFRSSTISSIQRRRHGGAGYDGARCGAVYRGNRDGRVHRGTTVKLAFTERRTDDVKLLPDVKEEPRKFTVGPRPPFFSLLR